MQQEVEARLGELVCKIQEEYPNFPMPKLTWFPRGSTAGWAIYGTWEIKINAHLAERQPVDCLENTVPHEVAHLLTWWEHGRVADQHGREWQEACRWLGMADPKACHRFGPADTGAMVQRRWPARCPCGFPHLVSTTLRNQIFNCEKRRRCVKCKGRLELI